MCFLTLQTGVERSAQQRHLVRAGGGRKRGNEKLREDGNTTNNKKGRHPMNSTCARKQNTI